MSGSLHPPLVELRRVGKRCGSHVALADFDFSIGRNEVIGLLGDNGAGKSTVIKLLSGINPPTSGKIFSEGRSVSLNSRRDSETIGIETIYQDIALVDDMNIVRNIFLGREETTMFGFLRKRRMSELATEILKQSVDIAGIRSPAQLVRSLSGGQKQAVAIARAVHFKRRILLLDEPTSALSVRETKKLLDYISVLKESGTSGVFVTHNIYHAFDVCDRFVIMSHGRKLRDVTRADTSVAELTEHVVAS